MKYLVIERKHNITITGGQAINNRLYHDIEINGHQVDYSTAIASYSSNLGFLFSNLRNIRKYHSYDRILIDSSTFPKTVWFVLLFRILYGRKGLTTTLHHFIYENLSGLKKTVYQLLELLFVKQCEEIIVFSPYVLDCCKQYVTPDRITYIGLPFEKNIMPSKAKRQGGLLFVGTIEPRKGLVFLIEALHTIDITLLTNIEVSIIGKVMDNRYYITLQKLLQQYHLEKNIYFRGRVSSEELAHYYETSTIFTFPSLLEGFGMVLIEAMGHGLPVVAFNNSAMPYTVKDGDNGLLVTNKDSEAFGKAIERLLTDKILYKKLSNGATATYENARSFDDFDNDVVNMISKHSKNIN